MSSRMSERAGPRGSAGSQERHAPSYPRPAFPRALFLAVLLAIPSPARAQAPTLTPGGPTAYVLAPDDQVDVAVQGHDDLKETATILPDGTFSYPILHVVQAAGLTTEGLTRRLEEGLSQSGQINGPQVTVSLRESRPRKVSIVGAVKAQGLFDYRTGQRLRDLVLEAGGPAGDAALTQATLLTADGRSLPIHLAALLDGSDPAQNLPLAPGDLLSVQARPAGQAQIVGEVAKPGAYDVPAEGTPITALLLQSGGATPKAALSRAQILHGGRVRVVSLRPLLDSLDSDAGRLVLCPGDVLLIPVNAARVAVLGEVRSPGAFDVPDGGSLSVTDALILAGSTTADADKKNAVLLRRGAGEGKPAQIAVNLDDALRGVGLADQALQPGDILYVPGRKSGNGLGSAQLLQFLPLLGLFGGRL